MITVLTVETLDVEIVKFAEVWPAVTTTFAPIEAASGLLLESATVTPPVGAATFSVTVAVTEPVPPTIEVGFTVTALTVIGLTVRVAVALEPDAAVMTDVLVVDVLSDVTVKVAEVCPWATTTDAGTVAADVVPLVSVTVRPPAGAGAPIVTVPVELAIPPTTVLGLSDRLATEKELTVNVPFADEPL